MQLQKGDIVTIIGISDWMATTTRNEIYATGENHTVNGVTKPVFKESSRARKRFTLRNPLDHYGTNSLVFLNVPRNVLTLDSEAPAIDGVTSFTGNACFNFMQTPLEIQALIESSNLNQDFTDHHRILSLANGKESPVLAYPDLYTPGTHAVIDRLITQPNLA